MLVLIAAIDASRMIVPANHTVHEAMREPWPTLLSAEPTRTDSDVAVLQLRASGTLARLIEPGNTQSVDILEPAVLRAGNAGGLTVHSNGKSVGPLGPHGSIREVEFKNGGFRLIPVK
jgi:hypothetical protein